MNQQEDRKGQETDRDWHLTLSAGDEVFWTDPDEGIRSGYRVIAEIVSDSGKIESDETVVRLKDRTEVFAGELSALKPGEPWKDKDFATGMVVNFQHPADTRIDVLYSRFSLIGGLWKEGYQRRAFSMTINNQCNFFDFVMDVKRAADALGIDFGDRPTIVVEIEKNSQLVNGYDLCAAAAKKLGWDMTCPEWLVPKSFEVAIEID